MRERKFPRSKSCYKKGDSPFFRIPAICPCLRRSHSWVLKLNYWGLAGVLELISKESENFLINELSGFEDLAECSTSAVKFE